MGADQCLRRLTHARHIQRPVIPGDFLGQMRRPHRIVVDHIAIAPRHGRKARMEMRRHRLRPGHADIARQIGIGPHDPGDERAFDAGIEMHHLATGMHRGIGTAGTVQGNRFGSHLRQGLFKHFLHGRHASLLALPATVAGTLVFDAEGDSGNACGSHFGCRRHYWLERHDQAIRPIISRASCC
ncbi:hypothetical protein D3C81_1651020 [compost metagenome]